MEIGRHAEDVGDGGTSIQLLQMPWNNIPSRQPSRQTSRQPSQDLLGRPQSRDSMHSGGGGYPSSISRFLDESDFGRSSPPYGHQESGDRAGLVDGNLVRY